MSDPQVLFRPLAGRHVAICNWRDSSHPQAGGAEQYCEHVAEELAALGAKVTYLTSRSKGAARRQVLPWGRIIRKGGTLTTYPRVLAWLALHRRSIDAVLDSQNGIPYFSPLAVGRSTPALLLIHHVHQEQFDTYFPRPLNLVGRFLEKQVSRWVYGRRPICVVSPSTRASVRRQLRFRGPIFIAPNGLARPAHEHLTSRSADPTIVSVGRLVPHKRLELLVEALPGVLRDHPKTVVHIIGDGECMERLERLASELGVDGHVNFHGRLSDPQRDRLVAEAWLTVNPSAGEGWGLSVIEAAAAGVPAVAFRVPGLEDSVRPGETGWLVDHGQTLAAAVGHAFAVLSDPEEARRWAVRCQDWASAFTWAYTAERITQVFETETKRLDRGYEDRRSTSDSTTLVVLPPEMMHPSSLASLRSTDQVRMGLDAERVELLLAGADEQDILRALSRLGISQEDLYSARIARYRDHLGWKSKQEYRDRHRQASAEVDVLAESLVVDLTGDEGHDRGMDAPI